MYEWRKSQNREIVKCLNCGSPFETQEQTSLQREKEANRMTIESQKSQLEREKMQTQKEIADKQLQVARTNKNKYDKEK